MSIDVVMPQMGESIFEGTITKWLKKTGDAVLKDEPLFEISTDKVDAEIPSPVAGVLTEIIVPEGSTVAVNTVVAVLAEGAAETTAREAGNSKSDTEQSSFPSPNKAASSESGTEVVMPQMGESIFEGTITRWMKKAGEQVRKDEPLFEISTDKVDAEIPAPVSGVLTEIRVAEGSTVQINTVVGIIEGETPTQQPNGLPVKQSAMTSLASHSRATVACDPAPMLIRERIRSSPLVRRIARENQLDLRYVLGTGSEGRITKDDVLRFLADHRAGVTAPPVPVASSPSGMTPAVDKIAQPAPSSAPQRPQLQEGLLPMSRMRGIIAQRMVESRRTSPHAYSVYKIDMTRIVRLREREKAAFEQRNRVKLTYMPFIASAVVDGLCRFPILNASLENGSIRYHKNVHLGIAVALEWGLIVPVVMRAEELNFVGLARAISELAERARTKKLKPEEAAGSTFTVTNAGAFGGDFGTPIINQPEAAILAIGGLRKEPAVLTDGEGNDTIAIRSVLQLCIGFDHRLIDGADAGRFMLDVQNTLEHWERLPG